MINKNMDSFEWLVVGAGCAGIAAVGKLIDYKVLPNQIGWLDPFFQVGDLGAKWRNVRSNSKTKYFLKFLNVCHAFNYDQRPHSFGIDAMDPEETCYLRDIVEPLEWVTKQLLKKVNHLKEEALSLKFQEGYWHVHLSNKVIKAKNVILATGAEPKTLTLDNAPETIPLEMALDPDQLQKTIQPHDTIGVFGSSHSAVLILAHLMEAGVHKAYNFYIEPHVYAVYLDDWILFDDLGLKGFAAEWARKYLDGKLPSNFERHLVTHPSFTTHLTKCNKVIYAVGLERRKAPTIEPYNSLDYQRTTGIIAPQLFGVGVAFPQAKFDRLGNLEYRVGVWKFMDYLTHIVPIWLQYGAK